MSTSLSPAVRCPQCSAHVRPGSDWCTLCYADLRPAPPATPAPAAPAPAPAEPEPLDGPVALPQEMAAGPQEGLVAPSSRPGKHARRAPADREGEQATAYGESLPSYVGGEQAPALPAAEVEALAAQMLAELAATRPDNPLGRAAGALDTPAKRVALMIGGTVAAMAVLFILMAAVGALL